MRRGVRLFLLAFGAFFLAASAWSFACPLGSPPDEPAHLIRAASLVRGQLVGRDLPGATQAQGSYVIVGVPEVFASLANDVACFKRDPKIPAGCQAPLVPSPQDQSVESYVGRYPPLYYAITGLPTLAFVSVGGVYAARLVSAALCALMLALAVVSARRVPERPLLPTGVALGATPMVLYLGGALNPSGFEAACGVAAFAGAVALARLPLDALTRADVARLGVPALCLMLVRALSPVWAVVAVAVLCLLRGWPATGALLRRRAVRAWLAAGGVAGALSLAWDFAAGGLRLQPGMHVRPGTSALGVAHLALDRLHLIAVSSIGLFGWLDTSSPYGVVAVWALATAALVAVAVVTGSGRERLATLGTALAWAAFAYVFVLAMVPSHGLVGQGRDFLALAAGIPVVAGACSRPGGVAGGVGRGWRLAGAAVAVAFVGAQVADFYGTLRRYSVGTSGPMNAFAHVAGGWAPPVPGPVLVVCFTAGALGAAMLCTTRGPGRAPSSPGGLLCAYPPRVGEEPVKLS
ncbi:MAG TPA: DUF2142 domain-containing protein [Acidimicrobiales bacterium]|nr:DUF2142 domain-containing protein [Acidimicrobiales bacterium]